MAVLQWFATIPSLSVVCRTLILSDNLLLCLLRYVLELNLAPQLASKNRVNQMVHERLLHHLLRLTQRRQPTSETFDALVPKVLAVAEVAGLQRCTDEEEAQLARYVKVRQPPPSGRQCIAEEDVYMVARLVDEDADNQCVSLPFCPGWDHNYPSLSKLGL